MPMLKRLAAIKSWLNPQPHPFRLLLHLEWILLGVSIFKIFSVSVWFKPQPGISWSKAPAWNGLEYLTQFDQLTIRATDTVVFSLLIILGLMGLGLPRTRLGKWLYLLIPFAIIVTLGIARSWGLEVLSPLLLIILLRSCLIFSQRDRWIMAGLMWCIYPITLVPLLLVWVFVRPAIHSQGLFALLDTAVQGGVAQYGITPTSGGGVRLNFEVSMEQVNQFLDSTQDVYLFFLTDGALSFGLVLLFVLLLVNSVVNERNGRRKLAQAHEQLYQYSIQIEDQATLQERTRIARDIHDSLGHLLTTQNVLLQNAVLSLPLNPDEAKTFLDQSRQISSDALRELRQSIMLLRSDPLEGRSLEAAIAHLSETFHQATGLHPSVHIDVQTVLPARIQVAAYRIIEEALTNIQKYSEATQVKIQLQLESIANSYHFSLQIEDNGRGFQTEQNVTGFGLHGMKERAESLGGTFQIVSFPGAGCKVLAIFPLPQLIS